MPSTAQTLSIGEVASLSGLRASALRYYEDEGLISPVARVSGRRHYEASVLDRLAVIACAQDAGFTIAEVRELFRAENDVRGRWRELAERKLREVEAVIERAQATRRLLEESLDCDCVTLEQCTTVAKGPRGARRQRTSGR